MHRSRLLLTVPTATALVLAGGSPAWAGGDHHEGEDAKAEVISIADEAEAKEDASEVTVEFDYTCEGEGITATVVLEQKDGDVRYEDELEEGDGLECDGEKRTAEATLEPAEDSEDVENGKAEVTVTFEDEDGKELDSKTEEVEVSGVDEAKDDEAKDDAAKDDAAKDDAAKDDAAKDDAAKDDHR